MSVGWLIALVILFMGAAISTVVVVATLVLRQLLIVALLVIAPLAIVAWILPGTQKQWKSWSSNFMKLLMMFPIIMGFWRLEWFCELTAKIAYVDTHNNTIHYLTILLAYFLPFFFIPKTFKMGGAMIEP